MFKHITDIDLKLISLFSKDYAKSYTIREMTLILKINYPHAFNRVKKLVKQNIIIETKKGGSNEIRINLQNLESIKLLSYIDENQKAENPSLNIIIREIIQIDPFASIGLFGSRVSGKAAKDSDWDLFIITAKRRDIEKIIHKLSFAKEIQFQVFDIDEFKNSLLTSEETVVKHIIRNKQILYNPHPFYNIINDWEKIKNAQES